MVSMSVFLSVERWGVIQNNRPCKKQHFIQKRVTNNCVESHYDIHAKKGSFVVLRNGLFVVLGIKPAKDSQVWSEAAKYKFLEMAHNKSLVGLVCGREEMEAGEVVAMRLVDTSETERDVCLDEELLRMGVADKIR